MEYNEVWALDLERVRGFLHDQPDVTDLGGYGFQCGGCEIRLEKLPDKALFKGALPSTKVRMCGEDQAVEAIHSRFLLRFLSAGG